MLLFFTFSLFFVSVYHFVIYLTICKDNIKSLILNKYCNFFFGFNIYHIEIIIRFCIHFAYFKHIFTTKRQKEKNFQSVWPISSKLASSLQNTNLLTLTHYLYIHTPLIAKTIPSKRSHKSCKKHFLAFLLSFFHFYSIFICFLSIKNINLQPN